MWFLILYGAFAAWVLFDGLARRMGGVTVAWVIGTMCLGPVVLPVYLAKRPLSVGEIREGGTAWNILKNFAVLWSIVMAVAAFSTLSVLGSVASSLERDSDAALVGAGLGILFSIGLLVAVWFIPTIGAALLGFFLKKNSVVETGPTGTLVGTHARAGVANGLAGLLAAAVFSVIASGALAHRGGDSPPSHEFERSESKVESNGWAMSESKSEMDGTPEAILRLEADNEIRGVIGKHKPYLSIQCNNGRSQIVVNVGRTIQNEYGNYRTYGVRLKFDKAVPVRQRWTESTNHVALFSPAPTTLLKQLTKTDVLLFEFTPFQESETMVKFNVSGLVAQLKKVTKVCGVNF